MANSFEITYTDGTNVTTDTTLFDNVQAEKYLQKNHLGNAQEASFTFTSYVIYVALRRQGLTDGKMFEEWTQTVAELQQVTPDNDEATDPLA